MAERSFAEKCTSHVPLQIIQSNLRSKLAIFELFEEAEKQKTAVALATPRRGPTKAAILILDSGVDFEEDQILIDKNVTAALIKDGNSRFGIMSLYFEEDMPIGPYLDHVRCVCSKFRTDKIILGDDVNA
ncbi:hypothetical protein EVAR_60024_1 [Eumeta japonica]|uniref:Uncharacterized protein n=1 Tax=Eumeta variegata TaxID=151549 RepID=A0A4C1ZM98_EUMVA|nr:hypothetical protein EVAR_60024_1 [Eumeta japonica]